MVSSIPAPNKDAVSGMYERIFGQRQKPKQLSGAVCISLLKRVAPLDESIAKLMKLPEKLYRMGKPGEELSFSSDPFKSIDGVVASLDSGGSFPSQVSDYGILIHSRGSNVFCTMVDKSRKVIVTADVRNAFESQGGWDIFAANVDRAIMQAQNLQADGREFNFVINHNGKIETV